MSISAEEKNRYLRETAIILAREGFHTDRAHTGGLRVLLDGAPLCEVTESGGITYRGLYSSGNYDAAKRDFAVRSGLIPKQQIFQEAQLIEIYRCCTDTLQGSFELSYD